MKRYEETGAAVNFLGISVASFMLMILDNYLLPNDRIWDNQLQKKWNEI